MCLLQKRKFVLSITSRTKAKSSFSSKFSRNGVSHEHKEPESLYLPSVSLVALGPSKTSSSGMAKPRAFTPRVDEPERQDTPRHRPLALRRGARSVQTILGALIKLSRMCAEAWAFIHGDAFQNSKIDRFRPCAACHSDRCSVRERYGSSPTIDQDAHRNAVHFADGGDVGGGAASDH